MTEDFKLDFYKEFPKTCAPDDFWGQVRRTVNGKPVARDQIEMIVEAVCRGLALSGNDTLLDLCCGNGALSTLIFGKCRGGMGVDFSEHLIEIARKNFVKRKRESFLFQDVVDFSRSYPHAERFQKAVCYGSIQYLPESTLTDLLANLCRRFTRMERLFIGNIPDRNHAADFFGDTHTPGIEDSPDSPIGIWRTPDAIRSLAGETGWDARITTMPKHFHWAGYRFDALLTPVRR